MMTALGLTAALAACDDGPTRTAPRLLGPADSDLPREFAASPTHLSAR